MKRKFLSKIGSILIIVAFLFVACQKKGLDGQVHEFTLNNGMKWLLIEHGYAPVFAAVLQVKSGGVDELKGKTGLAHMLEHMSFKGTSSIGTTDFEAEKQIMNKIDLLISKKNSLIGLNVDSDKLKEVEQRINELVEEQRKYVVSNELWDIFTRNGASNLNAYTSKDVTTYHTEMPSSKLELWIYLMYQMISDSSFREFYPEKNVVLEELRTSIDNSPRGTLYKNLLSLAYKNSPYSWPTIGLKSDVEKLTRQDLRDFHDRTYKPECMVGAIVGDIDIDKTKELLEKYFGGLKGNAKVCQRTLEIDSPQDVGKFNNVKFDAEPMLVMAFHKPTVPNFDDYIFDVFSYALCGSESSRMQKHLVIEKRIAKRIACFNSYPGTRLPNLFTFYAEPFTSDSIDDLERAILDEIKNLETNPITPAEFEKVKNQMKTDFMFGIETNYGLAGMLVFFENIAGSWQYILNHPANIDKITIEDMVRVSKKYFVPENMNVVKLMRGNE